MAYVKLISMGLSASILVVSLDGTVQAIALVASSLFGFSTGPLP